MSNRVWRQKLGSEYINLLKGSEREDSMKF